MRKTALGCSILEGHDVADLPLVSKNSEILELELAKKVDKVSGKGLSTNDYTTAEKSKLAGIQAGATNYAHPSTHPASMIVEATNKRFMTDAERTKLSGIATGANNYTHPGSGTNPHGTTKTDVGLGSVLNYGIATKAQAEEGVSNAVYMTPLRVKEAIEKLSSGGIEEFGSNANGTFIKFTDGTLIMRMEKVKVNASSAGKILTATITFPYALNSTLDKVYSDIVSPDGDAVMEFGAANIGVMRVTTTIGNRVTLQSSNGYTFKSGDTANVNIVIIGRWK